MNIALPIITLVVGLIGGFFIGVYYLRRQMTNMQNDPEMLQKVAKQMGYNLNSKQMQRAQQMMKNPNMSGRGPSGGNKGPKRKSK
ncbi:YneF family protein [Paenibacillus zanthoxyli]|uniref:YneF family protein n=1 Tax=Paenibacillus zanthoxyli TaxID=369399 RepID=UPI00046F7DEE|nr:YneF family protein [Paenibacillus zanthoxyli]